MNSKMTGSLQGGRTASGSTPPHIPSSSSDENTHTTVDIDAEIRRLEEQEQELVLGNQRLHNQMNDLRELMKIVDSRYDNDAR
jgi:hypothetical protein